MGARPSFTGARKFSRLDFFVQVGLRHADELVHESHADFWVVSHCSEIGNPLGFMAELLLFARLSARLGSGQTCGLNGLGHERHGRKGVLRFHLQWKFSGVDDPPNDT